MGFLWICIIENRTFTKSYSWSLSIYKFGDIGYDIEVFSEWGSITPSDENFIIHTINLQPGNYRIYWSNYYEEFEFLMISSFLGGIFPEPKCPSTFETNIFIFSIVFMSISILGVLYLLKDPILKRIEEKKLSTPFNYAKSLGQDKNITIFMSYATKDTYDFKIKEISERLTEYTDIDDVLYWEQDMGDDIFKYMDANIEKCDVFLLFCSKQARTSEPVTMEWMSALKIKKVIIPIFNNERHIPTLLSSKLGVKFDERDLDDTIKKIYTMIARKLLNKDL